MSAKAIQLPFITTNMYSLCTFLMGTGVHNWNIKINFWKIRYVCAIKKNIFLDVEGLVHPKYENLFLFYWRTISLINRITYLN